MPAFPIKTYLQSVTAAMLLLAGTANPFTSGAARAADDTAAIQDLGATASGTIVSARVVLPMADKAGFAAALKARYTYGNPLFHHWMTPAEIAAFGPKATDIAVVTQALADNGLTVTGQSRSGATLSVIGSVAAVQRAFGSQIHTVSDNGTIRYAHVGAFQPHGALIGRVSGVSGLTVGVSHPANRPRIDADGAPIPAVGVSTGADAADTGVLDQFTNQCFTQNALVTLQNKKTTATYLGIGFGLSGKLCGHTPQQIAQHYGLDQAYAYGVDGRGQTIVIVDAYGSPTAKKNANRFFKAVGVTPFTDDNFQIIYPAGKPTKKDNGWAGETAMDIEIAHAIAPGAKIVLAVAPTAGNTDLQTVLQYVIDNHVGNAVSNSYSLTEAESDSGTVMAADQLAQEAAAAGMSLNYATGDYGDETTKVSVISVSAQAASPWATAVGGTSIEIPSTNGVIETGWGHYSASLGSPTAPRKTPLAHGFAQGGGGGVSTYFSKPAWQDDLPGTQRLLPDLSLLADWDEGAIVVEPNGDGTSSFIVDGGTSLATPLFSAMWALVDEAAGWNVATGSITPGSSFGLPGPQLKQFQSSLLSDALPIASTSQVSGIITTDGPTTTVNGFAANGLAQNPAGLTTLWLKPDGDYDVLTFNTDTSLTTTVGYDSATGRGVPNGPGAVALGLSLLASQH